MVPEQPTAVSNSGISRRNGAMKDWMWRRQAFTAPGLTTPPGKNRSVRRMWPSFRLRARAGSVPAPAITSVDPPPMSITRWGRPAMGTALMAPRWIRRASSTPDTTSTATPASVRARRRKSAALAASRTALVATATTSARWASAMRRHSSRAVTARSTASGWSRFMSLPPEPSRTGMRSVAKKSGGPPGTGRATTMCTELVPTSMAASGLGSGIR